MVTFILHLVVVNNTIKSLYHGRPYCPMTIVDCMTYLILLCSRRMFRISCLKMFLFVDPTEPPAFLQCGDWVYPLHPGISPALKTFSRTYMFPDVSLQPQVSTYFLRILHILDTDV